MKHSVTLIEKFLRDECNEAEKQWVKEYIAQHPEALQPYLTEESWHSFQPGELLPEAVSGKMMTVIEGHTFQKKQVNRRWYAAAAAVVLIISGGLLWTILRPLPINKTMAVKPVQTNTAPAATLRTVMNNTRKTMPLQLSDGSMVELAPESEVKYQEPFTGNRRDVYLKGQALFRVTGNKEQPFTVYAGQLGTTALGTVFKITAWDRKAITQVQLISGKVVVKPDHAAGVYLRPGQALRYDRQKMLVTVNDVIKKDKIPSRINEIITFSNEPLTGVFRQMSEKYHVSIQYTASSLTGMNFTGTFDSSKETLKEFLTTIGTLNNLTINQKDDVIYIVQ
ncbi:FecR family protein [Chitinophaga sp. ARDCPP14]|uniref:FecR family protein n=1 Tax=Chitinophaga sp. ARDCPP14 TaxID=3391139 RepID=UPI003F521C97